MKNDLDIQNALRSYAMPIADNGFTASTLKRAEKSNSRRFIILAAAGTIGGLVALSQVPSLWGLWVEIDTSYISPFVFSALGVLGFVGWAALDRGWSDAV